jgi:hypothetical protein
MSKGIGGIAAAMGEPRAARVETSLKVPSKRLECGEKSMQSSNPG